MYSKKPLSFTLYFLLYYHSIINTSYTKWKTYEKLIFEKKIQVRDNNHIFSVILCQEKKSGVNFVVVSVKDLLIQMHM